MRYALVGYWQSVMLLAREKLGNLSHVHTVLWLKKENTQGVLKDEELETTLGRIHCSILSLISIEEVDEFVAKGLLESEDYAFWVKEHATKLLQHVCNARCTNRIGSGNRDLKCCVVCSTKLN
jgi:hypothetical protein